jgi:hypothetical protein
VSNRARDLQHVPSKVTYTDFTDKNGYPSTWMAATATFVTTETYFRPGLGAAAIALGTGRKALNFETLTCQSITGVIARSGK